MKLPEFKLSDAQWDAYRAFHIRHHNTFVQFDTGELTVNPWWTMRPAIRKFYPDLNVSLFMAHDQHSFLNILAAPDGSLVKRSWLKTGQCFVYDHDSARIVRLHVFNKDNDTVPSRFQQHNAKAYFAGPNRLPIGGAAIELSRPKKLPDDQRTWLKELITACKAADRVGAFREWIDRNYFPHSPIAADDVLQFMANPSLQMQTAMRVRLAKFGIKPAKQITKVDYLTSLK